MGRRQGPHGGAVTQATAVAGLLTVALLGAGSLPWLASGVLGGLVGVAAAAVGPLTLWRGAATGIACLATVFLVGRLLLVPVDLAAVLGFAVVLVTVAVREAQPERARAARVAVAVAVTGLVVTSSLSDALGWSVDEPATSDPRTVAGNGIVVALDTHAFLLQQGTRILRGDGHTAAADFLSSPDPTAPTVPATGAHESYLWRLQTGARDADRVLKKPFMPDHFFNWWTHSGKGLVAGPSGATWAEQQFADAVRRWRLGDRAGAMYHLGAAAHLVDDACAPPHEFPFVPHHRAYEEWVLARQDSLAVSTGGIYAADFRQRTGHGGPEWSSAHTRGWVDECAHRAAELVVNTMQPAADGPGDLDPPAGADGHFRETQRLTAGYLAFFFDSVGGP